MEDEQITVSGEVLAINSDAVKEDNPSVLADDIELGSRWDGAKVRFDLACCE